MTSLIRKILLFLFGKKQADDFLSGYVAKNSVTLFFLHCAALILGFLLNYTLIKTAGVNTYGSYVYIFNLVYLLAGFCIMGVDTLLVKKIAVYHSESNYSFFKGIISFSFLVVIISSITIALISGFVFNATGLLTGRTTINWFFLAIILLLMLSITAVSQASLQGLKKIVFSQLVEKIFRPLTMIITVLLFFYFSKKTSVEKLVWMNIVIIGAGMLITMFLFQKSLPFVPGKIKANYVTADWLKSSLAFFLISGFYTLNARIDVFLLGLYKPDSEIAVYNIALRLSEVVGFGLVIINFVIAPVVAGLFSGGKQDELQRLITRSSRAVLFLGLPFILLIIIFRHPVLSFFDVDLLKGHIALLILCFGQLINIFFGSVGLLLTMTGFQKYSIISLVAGTVVNIGLNIILIPGYGLVGTAVATAASLILWNCLMYFFVRKQLGIRTTALGII